MAVKLITGVSGDRHITPTDDANLYKNIVGSGLIFLTKPTLKIVNNNQVSLSPCEILINGRYIRITTTENIRIENGVVGTNRKDYIYLEFVKSNNIENVVIRVQKGSQPYENSSVFGDSNNSKVIIGHVQINGINIQSVNLVTANSITLKELAVSNDTKATKSELTSQLNTKANKSDVSSLTSRVSTLESRKNATVDYITSVTNWNASGITNGKIVKYSSGRCEIYGSQTFNASFTVFRGGDMYSTKASTLTLPVTFRSNPVATADVNLIAVGYMGYIETTTTKLTYALVNKGNDSGSVTVHWRITGQI